MGFVKVYKTKAYFKRFQTKYRRRREGKTDYFARKRLITQDKDKYNTPKYRFVARLTNSRVICQVIYSTLVGDKVVCQANSVELKKWGLTAGLTNYSSAYCTGLLCARRLLKKVGMDQIYTTVSKINGEHYDPADDDKERRPFKAVLDVGLVRTTCGNRVFGALKGACDGGLHIPHSTKRFPGFTQDEDKEEYNAKLHRERIFGVHVDKFMKDLKADSDEDYLAQFSKWDECLKKNKVDSVEKLMTKIHDEIKKNPDFTKKKALEKPKREHIKFCPKKLTREQKKVNIAKKFEIAMKNKK